MLKDDAQTALNGANLAVGTISTATSGTLPADHVISQNPAGGTSAAEGSPVDLVISLEKRCQILISDYLLTISIRIAN
jgi:beta-lactam-binding protein with PASTA domain